MGGGRNIGGSLGGGVNQTDALRPITLKSIAETQFQSAAGGQTASR